VIHRFAPHVGGVQQYLHEICRHIAPGSIRVLTEPAPGDRPFDAVQTYPIQRARFFAGSPRVKPGWLPALREAARLCRQHDIDLIQFGILHEMDLMGPVLSAWRGTPYLVYTYGLDIMVMDKHPIKRWMRRLILGRAACVVAVSQFVKERLLELGVPPEKVTVAYPGVDAARFRPGLDSACLRQRHRLEGRKVLLSVGRLVARKGWDRILSALPELIGRVPDLIWMIVGEGPERYRLERRAERLGVRSHVCFAGAVPDEEMALYYNLCDLFVLLPYEIPETGDVEGFGMVFLEASACGKAVVGSGCGGVKEAILNLETGLIIPQDCPHAFIEATSSLLLNSGVAGQMGERGRRRVLECFTWPGTVHRLGSVWEQAAALNRRRHVT